jgi:hypothetical protein
MTKSIYRSGQIRGAVYASIDAIVAVLVQDCIRVPPTSISLLPLNFRLVVEIRSFDEQPMDD